MPGRIGDTPVIGAGTYANNQTCAVSCTGDGEYFIRAAAAHEVSALMQYRGVKLQEAAQSALDTVKELGGTGGLIAIDKDGAIAMPFNTNGMYRGYVDPNAPIDALRNASRGFAEHPEDFARLGLHRIEDFASAWVLDEAGVRAVANDATANSDDLNFLAARSARVGKEQLTGETLRAMLKSADPLVRAPGLDRVAVIRALANRRMRSRATDLALAADGAVEEAGLGWVELADLRMGRASRYFARSLELSPGNLRVILHRARSQLRASLESYMEC